MITLPEIEQYFINVKLLEERINKREGERLLHTKLSAYLIHL